MCGAVGSGDSHVLLAPFSPLLARFQRLLLLDLPQFVVVTLT